MIGLASVGLGGTAKWPAALEVRCLVGLRFRQVLARFLRRREVCVVWAWHEDMSGRCK